MRRTLSLLAVPILLATGAFAESWSGSLLDSSCYDRQYSQLKDVGKAATACTATDKTTTFALHATGKVLKFDSSGNTKAKAALASRADRLVPGAPGSSAVNATVSGTATADEIAVSTVEIP